MAYLKDGAASAREGNIVTFGIQPTKAETGYGYIEAGEQRTTGLRIKSFKEKPDLKTAQTYLEKGNYYWNSGLFAFTLDTFFAELQKHSPEIYTKSSAGFREMSQNFAGMPNISIDYALAEKSDRIVVIPMDLTWNDVGSWDALYEVLPKDETGNVKQGDCIIIDCQDSLIIGRDRLIAGIGLEETIVVETDDVIVVAKKGETQKVKDLVDRLKMLKRKEAEEHTTTYRPWGSYTVLGDGPGYKMKRISVAPGQRLSLQMHYHRSEHWIVTKGTAKVTIGQEEKMVHENESVFVPKSTKHRLENPGRVALEIIEVQNGTYLEEDDIVRFEDIYGRT
jgi:mannose-1-phosphate guanylyltransferase/mannose-6-phosphate isomerase